jgi:chemotaxis protein methyltransferase CheR
MPERGSLELSDAEFLRISSYVHQNFGIHLKSDKKELVKSRLSKKVAEHGFDSYRQYFDYVLSKEGSDELIHMIDALSTNLTYFFREAKHFDVLKEMVLPELIKENAGVNFKIRAWCAASSSGEEPYTITMVVKEALENVGGCDFKLLATDISTRMLSKAKQGVYKAEAFKDVHPILHRKYFLRGEGSSSGMYKAKKQLGECINFNYLNLVKPFPMKGPLDFIFCRNVMIYFDQETQQKVIDRMVNILKPGGYLFMGMSEGLSGIQHQLKYVQPSIYRKGAL